MSTKQRPSGRGRSSSRATGPRGGSGRHAEPPRRHGLGALFEGHGHDVAGVGLAVLGVLSGFGVYAHSAGPVGTGLAAVLGAVFGLLRVLVPPALVAGGVLMVVGPRGAEDEPRSVDPQADALRSFRSTSESFMSQRRAPSEPSTSSEPPPVPT